MVRKSHRKGERPRRMPFGWACSWASTRKSLRLHQGHDSETAVVTLIAKVSLDGGALVTEFRV